MVCNKISEECMSKFGFLAFITKKEVETVSTSPAKAKRVDNCAFWIVRIFFRLFEKKISQLYCFGALKSMVILNARFQFFELSIPPPFLPPLKVHSTLKVFRQDWRFHDKKK